MGIFLMLRELDHVLEVMTKNETNFCLYLFSKSSYFEMVYEQLLSCGDIISKIIYGAPDFLVLYRRM